MARGRPRTARLSSEIIVDTAMRTIDGGSPLSMSHIARELSVHVSSLYNHVGDRDGLIELLRVRISEEYPVPPLDGLTWQDAVRTVATTIHTAFLAHPRLIPYLADTPVSSPGIVEIYARLAEAMVDAGHSAQRASITIRMIDTLALGTAMVTSSSPAKWNDRSPGGQALIEAAETWDDDRDQTSEAFELSLRFILAGLEGELAEQG
ncbi:TetR/AcrR family transcriptional regulator C-terminal domain-containing protein [Leucobacter rhizosphaerae]|uniref:TetR/AcrR family transcriptional regulator C-terminal domain-containing protein n=1 Tax=Leucobacter rhizosphaerae TaxID=2932245 RepID=A0ABY4FS03_9MICO|nr:TetR/AcrR family transcriptional regulator C-terminal domain-containing protein [Leucobacter rhizosphaerae]UOQ59065.1 TetR/AcrR family transcriptional regulator C-terminal domain-containing protein [Leucobacter rhizosphaerae]